MGSEVLEECRPIIPMPTISIQRNISNLNEVKSLPSTDHDHNNPKQQGDELLCLEGGGEEECRTPPRSVDQHMLMVCPPPPRKARPPRRKLRPRSSSQRVLKVPEDLTSVFMLLTNPSKKIRTS
uniref:Uncharacterized protein n=1 Tax=Cannabis sativa TaxID=3483 RepID=A0A803Q857_CANSA